jgi:hypothetical protein
VALLAHPTDEAINVEGWQLLVVVPKCCRHSMEMSQPTLHIRKPLAGYAAVIALQLNAEVTSPVQRGGDQGAAGAGEGIVMSWPGRENASMSGVRIVTAFCVG